MKIISFLLAFIFAAGVIFITLMGFRIFTECWDEWGALGLAGVFLSFIGVFVLAFDYNEKVTELRYYKNLHPKSGDNNEY